MNPGRGNLFRCAVRETEGQKSNVFRNFGRREGFPTSGEVAIPTAIAYFYFPRVSFSARTRSTAAEDMIESDGACAEEDQSKSQRGCGQGELETVIAGQAVVPIHFPDRDHEVHADGESRDPGKEARQYEQAAQEFREGRNVAHPMGETKSCHQVGLLMQAAENFVVAVHQHNRAQGKTHDEKRKWLQAFRVAQGASGYVTRLQQRLQQKRGAA